MELRKRGIMIVRKNIDITAPLSEEQKKMLSDAAKRPIVFDEDSPELTDEQLRRFVRVSRVKSTERRTTR